MSWEHQTLAQVESRLLSAKRGAVIQVYQCHICGDCYEAIASKAKIIKCLPWYLCRECADEILDTPIDNMIDLDD